MNILIFGGTGAMGVHMVEILKSTVHNVTVTSRAERASDKNIRYVKCNAKNLDDVKSVLDGEQWDVLVDFMIYGSQDFKARLPLLLSSAKHYFFFSSSRVYADSSAPITENSPRLLDACKDEEYLKTDEYALAKAREENVLRSSEYKNWTIIRPYITYDVYRLQLGVYEKETWLYRAVHGRTIVFDKNVAEKLTTMTTGYDVAKRIVALFGNEKAFGEAYHITTGESIAWGGVLSIYKNVLEEKLGRDIKVKLVDTLNKKLVPSVPQFKFDRMYNRRFDNSKINSATGMTEYVSLKAGIEEYISKFLELPKFRSISWADQARMDRLCKEHTPLSEIVGVKNKLKYIAVRYFGYKA